MSKLRARFVSLRDLLAMAWPIILITAVGFVVAYQFVQPAPPRHMTISTGSESGAYYKSRPPLLQRYLALWIAVLVERLFVLIVPVVVLLLPLLKVAPSVYRWRIRSKIFRCYGDLKFMENDLRLNYDPGRRAEYLARLDRIEDDAYARNIPLAFSDLLYTLREHINLVRDKLNHLGSGPVPEDKP